jgi:cell division transport system permease protein
MFLAVKRTFKEALHNFLRNGWLSIAAVSILILSLYVVSVIYVVTFTIDDILKNMQEKVNISVYFKSDVENEKIDEMKKYLNNYMAVKSVEYVSKEQALEDFKKDNANEPAIMQALQEIGENPLQASLVIKANNAEQYQNVVDYIEKSEFKENISRINYNKNKEIIKKLNNIIAVIRKTGIVLGFIFFAIAILVIFNTIRITIYTHRHEIEIMRLVGASNYYIRLPFAFEGFIYGLTASLVSVIVLFITLRFMAPFVSVFIPSENLIGFYFSHFWKIFGMQLIIGSFLGVFGSWIAMRRYLKT